MTSLTLLDDRETALMVSGVMRLRLVVERICLDGHVGQVGQLLLARDELAEARVIEMGAVRFATGIFTLPEAIALARPCESELLVGHGVGPDIAGRSR